MLAAELGRHMEQHNLTAADIDNVTLGGDKAEFINFVGTYLGQGCKARVSYTSSPGERPEPHSDGHGHCRVVHASLSRIAPALERLKNSSIVKASVNIPRDGNQPEQLDRFLS